MIRLATRGSRLARWQAERVAELLGGDCELVIVDTTGDQRADVPIAQMAGQGVFVKEVQAAVLDGRADCAVHSAKDLPSHTPEGLVLAAVPERAEVRDALIGTTFDALPTGAHVATGSVRRRAQLANLRPDLVFSDLRGNIETRLEKAAQFDAIVMAAAALQRLDRMAAVAQLIPETLMVPQVGQGAIAVECRTDNPAIHARVAAIDAPLDHHAVRVERAFLATIAESASNAGAGTGCDLPTGAWARRDGERLIIHTMLATLDGRAVIRRDHHADSESEPEGIGAEAAHALLRDAGASIVLHEVNT